VARIGYIGRVHPAAAWIGYIGREGGKIARKSGKPGVALGGV
jgi:hypothetical protein